VQFLNVCAAHQTGLDSAISKSPLSQEIILYSGHGRGAGVIGALTGDPSQFVGLVYNYPGFISTSVVEQVALDTLEKRANKGSRPILLELHLPAGFPALDMALIPGGGNEFEYLIGRNVDLLIFAGAWTRSAGVVDDILHLKLRPAVEQTEPLRKQRRAVSDDDASAALTHPVSHQRG
jgi:ADP-ribosyltransferase exoenzyme